MTLQDTLVIGINSLAFALCGGMLFILPVLPRRRPVSRRVGLFLGLIALWAACSVAAVVPDLSPFTARTTATLRLIGTTLAPPALLLLAFATYRLPDGRALAGVIWVALSAAVTVILIASGRAFAVGDAFDLTVRAGGVAVIINALALGLLAALIVRLSAWPRARALQVPAGLLLIGVAAAVIAPVRDWPVGTGLAALAAGWIGTTVLRWQVIDPLDDADQQVGAADADLRAALRDLARERARSKQFEADLREANAYRSVFLANMSHELRTPLNSIVGYSELLLKSIYGEMSDMQLDRVEKINRNGLNLLAVINDILDLSKIESGRLELALTPIRLDVLIGGVIPVVEPLIGDKTLAIQVNLDDSLRPILADEQRIRQVFQTLISNAIQSTPAGQVRVTACSVLVKDGQSADFPLPVLGWLADRAWLIASIEDTGPTIAPEEQASIFEAFHQTAGETARQYGGGLRLAMAKKLVELHTGRIWLRSQPEQGCTFFVALPALDTPDTVE